MGTSWIPTNRPVLLVASTACFVGSLRLVDKNNPASLGRLPCRSPRRLPCSLFHWVHKFCSPILFSLHRHDHEGKEVAGTRLEKEVNEGRDEIELFPRQGGNWKDNNKESWKGWIKTNKGILRKRIENKTSEAESGWSEGKTMSGKHVFWGCLWYGPFEFD